MRIIAGAITFLPLVFSIAFALVMRRRYLRSNALHDRFMKEDALCKAAQERGDLQQARKHLEYMKILHAAHDE